MEDTPERSPTDRSKEEWERELKELMEESSFDLRDFIREYEASLVTAMGRMAAHTGRVITWDQMLNHEHELAPTVDQLTMESPAPVRAGTDGKYPVPQPGIKIKREF